MDSTDWSERRIAELAASTTALDEARALATPDAWGTFDQHEDAIWGEGSSKNPVPCVHVRLSE